MPRSPALVNIYAVSVGQVFDRDAEFLGNQALARDTILQSIESIDSIEVANMYRFSFTRQARLGPLADGAEPRHAERSSMRLDHNGIVGSELRVHLVGDLQFFRRMLWPP